MTNLKILTSTLFPITGTYLLITFLISVEKETVTLNFMLQRNDILSSQQTYLQTATNDSQPLL
jgi:hypothetical protein